MARAKPLIVRLPFAGFYESMWSGEVDHIEEREAEHLEEREGEEGVAPELRLTASEFSSILFDVTDYGACYAAVARTAADAFNVWASEQLDMPLGLTFESMSSPKFYNFETDRLFAFMPRKTARALFAISKAEGHERLARLIHDRFTSRSGFISSYDNELADWLAKPLMEWDHNELGTLLEAVTDYGDDGDWHVFEAATDCDGLHHEWVGAVDWNRFAEAVQVARDDKLEAIREQDPDYTPPPARCPMTLDLFATA